MMQSLIQQFGGWAGTLSMRQPQQMGMADAYLATNGLSDAAACNTADERIKVFSNLLQTVCRKLLLKIRELDCVNADLSNLMKVCAMPVILVDEKLTVRSFTKESRAIFRLSHKDVGRSLLDVTSCLNYFRLAEDFQRAAETGKCVNRSLERRGCENRYFMRILPNFSRDNSFGGAVLIFIDVESQYWGTA